MYERDILRICSKQRVSPGVLFEGLVVQATPDALLAKTMLEDQVKILTGKVPMMPEGVAETCAFCLVNFSPLWTWNFNI